ncbi:MAG: glycosyltransferase family 2 protein [Deltaproteobacteria bacterium]|nr:glycosyltransferase family 2 protein [Deltaproteobacteria bacterium]
MNLDLAIVMPVYNEEECIESVLLDWLGVLDGLDVSYRMIVLDDGSKDRTADKLAKFDGDSRIHVVKKVNTGHGPTILTGYKHAAGIAEWVFQCDSDNEMPASGFRELWQKRSGYDAVLGYRVQRNQPLQRKVISVVARRTVSFLFGKGVFDVNVPYRLIQSQVLSEIISRIPEDSFAPNVIISGVLVKRKVRVLNLPVLYQPRSTGHVSIVSFKLYRAAALSFIQTLRVSKSL